MLHIVKMGGKLTEDEFLLNTFLIDFYSLHGSKILIHGGGSNASVLLKKLGILPKMAGGRRITNTKTLEVLVMTYAGLLNKELVVLLQALGANAIGCSGADGNLICSSSRSVKIIDYGHVGDFNKKSINIIQLYSLIQMNYIPVLCAITHDSKGNLLNTNADTIAAYIAITMSEIEEIFLYYCFEKKGVLKNINNEISYFAKINFKNFESLKNGMIPKFENAFYALRKGVKKVSIGHSSYFNSLKDKTLVYL